MLCVGLILPIVTNQRIVSSVSGTIVASGADNFCGCTGAVEASFADKSVSSRSGKSTGIALLVGRTDAAAKYATSFLFRKSFSGTIVAQWARNLYLGTFRTVVTFWALLAFDAICRGCHGAIANANVTFGALLP